MACVGGGRATYLLCQGKSLCRFHSRHAAPPAVAPVAFCSGRCAVLRGRSNTAHGVCFASRRNTPHRRPAQRLGTTGTTVTHGVQPLGTQHRLWPVLHCHGQHRALHCHCCGCRYPAHGDHRSHWSTAISRARAAGVCRRTAAGGLPRLRHPLRAAGFGTAAWSL